MAIQSVTVKHNGKNYKVYKGQKGGMYIVRKNQKVYLQSGAGFLGNLRAKAAKRFTQAKDKVKSIGQGALELGAAAMQSAPMSALASGATGFVEGAKGFGSAIGSMIGGSMYLQMSEQFGGQGISVRIDGKSRKVFVTKSGKFYYKQGNKKVYVKQNGAGFSSMFKAMAKKAMPMAKNIFNSAKSTMGKAMNSQMGQEMLNSAMTPVAPVAVAPV